MPERRGKCYLHTQYSSSFLAFARCVPASGTPSGQHGLPGVLGGEEVSVESVVALRLAQHGSEGLASEGDA